MPGAPYRFDQLTASAEFRTLPLDVQRRVVANYNARFGQPAMGESPPADSAQQNEEPAAPAPARSEDQVGSAPPPRYAPAPQAARGPVRPPFTWDAFTKSPYWERMPEEKRQRAAALYWQNFEKPNGVEFNDSVTQPGFLERLKGGAMGVVGGFEKTLGFEKAGEAAEQEGARTSYQMPYGDSGWGQLKNLGSIAFYKQVLTHYLPEALPYIAAAWSGAQTGTAIAAAAAAPTGPGEAVAIPAGAVLGAMVGLFGIGWMRTFGDAHSEYLKAHPGDDRGASNYAFKQAGINGAIAAAAEPLGFVGAEAGPLKHAIAQLALQGGTGAGAQVISNALARNEVAPDRELSQGLLASGALQLARVLPVALRAAHVTKGSLLHAVGNAESEERLQLGWTPGVGTPEGWVRRGEGYPANQPHEVQGDYYAPTGPAETPPPQGALEAPAEPQRALPPPPANQPGGVPIERAPRSVAPVSEELTARLKDIRDRMVESGTPKKVADKMVRDYIRERNERAQAISAEPPTAMVSFDPEAGARLDHPALLPVAEPPHVSMEPPPPGSMEAFRARYPEEGPPAAQAPTEAAPPAPAAPVPAQPAQGRAAPVEEAAAGNPPGPPQSRGQVQRVPPSAVEAGLIERQAARSGQDPAAIRRNMAALERESPGASKRYLAVLAKREAAIKAAEFPEEGSAEGNGMNQAELLAKEDPEGFQAAMSAIGRAQDARMRGRAPVGASEEEMPVSAEERQALREPAGEPEQTLGPRAAAERPDVGALVSRAKTMLGDKTLVEMAQKLRGGAAGEYDAAARAIRVALDAVDPEAVLDHEAMHAARAQILSELQNRVLEAKFREGNRWSQRVQKALEQAPGYERAAGQLGSVDERIAYGFQLWRQGRFQPDTAIGRIFERLAESFERVRNWLRGSGFQSAADVFRALDEGRLAGQEGAGGAAAATAASQGPRSGRVAMLKRLTDALQKRDEYDTPAAAAADAKTILDDALSPEQWRRDWARDHIKVVLGKEGLAALDELAPQQSLGPTAAQRRAPFREDVAGPDRTVDEAAEAIALAARAKVEPPPFTRGVNTTALKFSQDSTNRVIAQMAESFPDYLEKVRGGAEHIGRWRAAAVAALRRGDITVDKVLDWPDKARRSPVQMMAGRFIEDAHAKWLADNAHLRGGTDEQRALYGAIAARTAVLVGKVEGGFSTAGKVMAVARHWEKAASLQGKALREVTSQLKAGKVSFEDYQDMVASLRDPGKIVELTKQAWKPKWYDYPLEVWINGLLSNPVTLAKKFITDQIAQGLQVPETLMAAGFGRLHKGERVYAGEALARYQGFISGSLDAFKAGVRVWKTGESEFLAGENRHAIPGKVGDIVRVPSRNIEFVDKFNKTLAYRAELRALAYREAMADGLHGEAFAMRFQQYVNTPTEPMRLAAMETTHYLTMTAKLGKTGRAFQNLIQSNPLLRLIFPFQRTPIDLIKFGAERSPAALLMPEFYEAMRTGGAARDFALARLSLGTASLVALGTLAANGRITGDGPSDPRAMATWRATGWQPRSILVGDRYYSYGTIEPLGIMLGTVATYAEISHMMKQEDALTVGGHLVGAFFKTMLSRTYLRGLSDMVNAATDPERKGGEWLGQMAASFVPYTALLGQVNRMIDPNLREARGILGPIQARIPGWAQQLPPRFDIRGQPITMGGALGPVLFSPIYESVDNADQVAHELVGLGANIGMPGSTINQHKLDAGQRAMFNQLAGQQLWRRLGETMAREDWQGLSDDRKLTMIERVTARAHGIARNEMKRAFPELAQRPQRAAAGQ